MPRALSGAALLALSLTLAARGAEPPLPGLRPPAVPLVAHHPYFSIWSPADRLTDVATAHWTGKPHPLTGLVRIDGRAYRVLGAEPAGVPALPQTGREVTPTRTVCRFGDSRVSVVLTFLTPALPDDLDVLARPVTYVTWEAASVDGRPHDVQVYFDCGAELAVNTPEQEVAWDRPAVAGLAALRVGSTEQHVLGKKGDDVRIDWGHAWLAAAADQKPRAVAGAGPALRGRFAAGQPLEVEGPKPPAAVKDARPALAVAFDLGSVTTPASRWLMLAYDEEYAVRYFGARLRPYWRRTGLDAAGLLQAAARDRDGLVPRCRDFDERLTRDLAGLGGEKYARLCVLAYRQALAGNGLAADAAGGPLLFPKENFSNGCIGTVDVLFPQAPFFLALSPGLTRAMLVPVLDYASSPRWPYRYAPHDLGTYPHATGQVYGMGPGVADGVRMPVEECGNMLLMLAALARAEPGRPLAAGYLPLLRRWAEYLVLQGLDPPNQLCSADMFGHMAHNANLSLKAVLALGAFGLILDRCGEADEAHKYRALARAYAADWQKMAAGAGRTRLAFDRPGTWGMKHNLVWDRVLGLGLFPDAVGDAEAAWYRKVQNRYGLPCDNRTDTCLIDWAVWCAALAREPAAFEALVAPLYAYADETPSRVPLSDWFSTRDGRQKGFQARPVVGGLFIKMLTDGATWARWAGQGAKVGGGWAPFPEPADLVEVVPTARQGPQPWRYTLTEPTAGWQKPEFDDRGWKGGPSGFGTRGTPGAVVRTEWNTKAIWLRREFTLPEGPREGLVLLVHYDEAPEVYLNGVPAARRSGYTTEYEEVPIAPAALAALKSGRNVLAVRASQTWGGQSIDVGLAVPAPPKAPR